ncbi:MAG TPA: YfcE family phosphodiesterase [Candidatus Thermoplasmatota archaeon]|nr:YfcE family phosphodiesterase [Candidatus Thermoplasmatota archaeon]
MNEDRNNLDEDNTGDEYCIFAVTTLQPLLNTLENQIEGAAQATDIECIHKMRVTSRRIRAALCIFKSCFPKDRFRHWQQEIRNITRSLGTARDMDVQIEFLERHLQKLSDSKEKSAIEYLLQQHRSQRATLQSDVITHLDQLKTSGTIEDMKKFCAAILSQSVIPSAHSFTTYIAAQNHIGCRLDEFLALQDFIDQEDEIKKHHEMRIAAKHLRYTMEHFSPLYDKQLISYIDMMKQFQDVLGEMHDCDVWCAYIPAVLDTVKQPSNEKPEGKASKQQTDLETGLALFLKFIRTRRHTLYTEFVQYWEKNTSNNMITSLKELMWYKAVIPRSFPKKIAVLADIHGNSDALHAVLEDARKNNAALIIVAGDLVGYGAFPQEVVAELDSERVLCVLGNYDAEVLEWKKNPSPNPIDETEISLDYAVQQLQKPSIRFLKSLPKRVKLSLGEKRIFLTHGSPASIDEHIYPDTSEQRLKELSQDAQADVIIVGHSHTPFIRTVNQVMFVNPGSVGRPGIGDTRASYVLLTVHPFSLEPRKVPYDVMHAVDALRQRHLPDHFAQMLLQGTSLEQLLQQELIKTSQKQESFGHSIFTSWNFGKKKRSIKKIAERYTPDFTHASQVTRTALSLFDQLRPINPLGAEDRFWLECAGLLHDIGFSLGAKGHHKTSFRLILTDPFLPLTARERQMIGVIARYHRKKPPAMNHVPFGDLTILDRTRIELLAAILRVADGLDASHGSVVEKIDMNITDTSVMMRCLVNGSTQREEEMVNKKKDLFEKVFDRSLLITMQGIAPPKEKSLDSSI